MMQTAIHQPMAIPATTVPAATVPVASPATATTPTATTAAATVPIPNSVPSSPSPTTASSSPRVSALSASASAPVLVRQNDLADGEQTVVIVYGPGQDAIVHVVAEVLGKPWTTETSLASLVHARSAAAVVVGVRAVDLARSLEACGDEALSPSSSLSSSRIVIINTHCVDDGSFPDESLTERCDYEFLYSHRPFLRRDLTRFLALVLGQTRPHEALRTKTRTNFISTTFPDVHAALPNLDILSVGSDAVEIRVDLLVEPGPPGAVVSPHPPVPSLRYVGQQLMLLRQHTELPIIFTTRCTRENGKFPMADPALFYRYLRRALQWGCEYVDVELWLPEAIRRRLAQLKGHSVILSAFHDFSGQWRWTSAEAARIFAESARYADIVKMIAMVDTIEANYELEYFRSTVTRGGGGGSSHSGGHSGDREGPLLSAVNMGQLGQLSRALNTVFSPITHPLLPMIAAPGQLTAAEINEAMHIMGALPKRDLYVIGSFRATPQSMFMEKCFNELSLPHTLTSMDRGPPGQLEALLRPASFGGAVLNPPVGSATVAGWACVATISEAARAIGLVDTIVVRNTTTTTTTTSSGTDPGLARVGENASWKGIRATLTRDYVPSAYRGRAAIVLAGSESDAAAALYALRSLHVGTIYTVGFRARGPLAAGLEPLTSLQSVKRVVQPFVMVSALPPEKSLLVQPLLRHYRMNGVVAGMAPGTGTGSGATRGTVYLDLTGAGERKGDPVGVAVGAGWTAYGIEEVRAWTTVETMRLLVGQNVPFDFVRMASGRIYS